MSTTNLSHLQVLQSYNAIKAETTKALSALDTLMDTPNFSRDAQDFETIRHIEYNFVGIKNYLDGMAEQIDNLSQVSEDQS